MKSKSLISIALSLIESLEAQHHAEADLSALIDGHFGDLAEKVDGYVGFVNQIDAQRDWLEKEIEVMQAKLRRLDNIKEALKFKALKAMDLLGETKIEGEMGHKISIRNSESVEVLDEAQVPGEFLVSETKTRVDKIKVKTSLKAGYEVPGCELKTNRGVIFK